MDFCLAVLMLFHFPSMQCACSKERITWSLRSLLANLRTSFLVSSSALFWLILRYQCLSSISCHVSSDKQLFFCSGSTGEKEPFALFYILLLNTRSHVVISVAKSGNELHDCKSPGLKCSTCSCEGCLNLKRLRACGFFDALNLMRTEGISTKWSESTWTSGKDSTFLIAFCHRAEASTKSIWAYLTASQGGPPSELKTSE